MKKDKRKILRWIALVVATALLTTVAISYMYGDALSYLLIHGFVSSGVKRAQQMQVRLLCNTDHQALLEACRELSRRAGRGDLKPGRYNVRSDRHPKVSQFPKAILDLEPSYVYIDENDSGRVMVAMHGGLVHFGVEAYTEDYKKPSFVGFKFGDKELIPGLWYYDDGYDHNPLLYDKRIEELIKEHKGETFIKKLGTKKLR